MTFQVRNHGAVAYDAMTILNTGNVTINSGHLTIPHGKYLNFDGGTGDTYIRENGNTDELDFYTAASVAVTMGNNLVTFAGAIKIAGGSPADGKVWTATDSDGTGNWETPGGTPSGAIVMWHGTLSNIPSGWVLCDGSNSTPDLRDKFLKGAANGANPGSTGGATTHTHTTHALHPFHYANAAIDNTSPRPRGFSGYGTPNVHDAHNSPNHEPPYYTIAYIMKT